MESSVGIYFKGYNYFREKFDKNNTDIYKTTLLLQKAIVFKGEDAAKLFYESGRFKRKGATPKRFKKTLLGEGGVQGLDKGEHLHRKKMFMQVMGPDSLDKLQESFKKYWIKALKEWENKEKITLFHETEKILLRAACEWTGVPLAEKEVSKKRNIFQK